MLLNLDGSPKEVTKKKKKKDSKLSHEKMVNAIKKIMISNTESFCIFYTRDGYDYKVTNCFPERIDEYIKGYQKENLETTVFECLESYFYGHEEDEEILEQQEFLEKLIEELNRKNHDDEED